MQETIKFNITQYYDLFKIKCVNTRHNEVIGYIEFRKSEKHKNSYYIRTVYVKPIYQNQKIGQSLYYEAINYIKSKLKGEYLFSDVIIENNIVHHIWQNKLNGYFKNSRYQLKL